MQMCDCGEVCENDGDGPFCLVCSALYCEECGCELDSDYCPDCDEDGLFDHLISEVTAEQEWLNWMPEEEDFLFDDEDDWEDEVKPRHSYLL